MRAIQKGFCLQALILLCSGSLNSAEPVLAIASSPQPLPSVQLHNLFRVSTNVFSGAAPEAPAGFAEIAGLGVKTIISVDGSRPDVETARRWGLRYVHLPFGYDGVPSNRVAELTKAVQSAKGLIYVHCHHGLHRGPAAAAVICEATAGWTPEQAVAWLHQAGTATDYAGLYRSVTEFRAPKPAALEAVQPLPETAPASSLVEVMLALDRQLDRLKAAQKSNGQIIPAHPDVSAPETATLLWEQLRELGRADEISRRPSDFRAKLAEAESAADRLRRSLGGSSSATPEALTPTASLEALGRSCAACHRAHRN